MTTVGGRVRRVLPFLAVSLLSLPLALIGRKPGDSLLLVGLAAAVFLLDAALIVTVPWDRRAHAFRIVPVVVFCFAVAILRHAGGGATAGYGGLLLLPVINQAVFGRRRDVLATLACTTVTLALPILAYGAPQYPTSEWRRVILSLMTFTMTGLVVSRLMDRLTRHKQMFGRVIELTRDLDGPRVQASVCAAVLEATEADLVTFVELAPEGVVQATAADASADVVAVEALVLDHLPASLFAVATSGRSRFVPDVAVDPIVDQEAAAAHGIVSVLHQPVVLGGEVRAVISVAWRRPLRRLPEDVAEVVELLAAEAAVSIERSRLVAQLDRLAHHDQLTGVFNRLAWDEAFTRELARVDRTGESATLALLDFDHFKAYNDAHGHLVGDQLLKGATAAWTSELRSIDVLARWGGEEFVLLLPATDVSAARTVLDRLRDVVPDGQSFSAGVVAVDGRAAHDLLRAADAALYRAKDAGRARTVVAEPAPGTVRSTDTTIVLP